MAGAITTHVLDTARGRPAVGMRVTLERREEAGSWKEWGSGVTGADGRLAGLVGKRGLVAGVFRLRFEVESYFSGLRVEGFYPHVEIAFHVRNAQEHHHVPLLLSPFGYATYRGS
jgi:5-hydroxyisourate hydrolase